MWDELERKGYIKRVTIPPRKVDDSLLLAERDLMVARKVIDTDHDWAFNIAYNSILQAIRALLFKKGYRPSSRNSHIAVVKVAGTVLGEEDVLYLERMRRKRHRSVYDTAGTTSHTEAENAILKAEKILAQVKKLVDG